MNNVLLQPAYVLHRRSYRETSFLVDLMTPDHGRLTVLARGVRKAKSSSQGLLQPFTPLLVSWMGRGELMTLSHVEANGAVLHLRGDCLFAGFYLNELMMGLLQKWDAHPALYHAYANALSQLQATVLEEKILRSFEKFLLEELGYGLLPKSENSLHNSFVADKFYRYLPEQGFVLSELGDLAQANSHVFSGKSLLAMTNEDWHDQETLQDAKRLTRFVLMPLMGTRTIHSRRLFMQPHERKNDETK